MLLELIWCVPCIEYMVHIYSGMVNSSTLTAAWAMARRAAVSVARQSSGRLVIAGCVLPKTGIFILVSTGKMRFGRQFLAGKVCGWEIIRQTNMLIPFLPFYFFVIVFIDYFAGGLLKSLSIRHLLMTIG